MKKMTYDNELLSRKVEDLQEELGFKKNDLESKVKTLEDKIRSILHCDQCGINFVSKIELMSHEKMFHKQPKPIQSLKKRKCDNCEKLFLTNEDLQHHKTAKHKTSILKEDLLQKEICLVRKLNEQRNNINKGILELKASELKSIEKCECKGYCNINHSKRRWLYSKADLLNSRFKRHCKMLSLKCINCDFETTSEENLIIHIRTKHRQKHPFKCDKCEFGAKTWEHMSKHKTLNHPEKLLKSILKKKIG